MPSQMLEIMTPNRKGFYCSLLTISETMCSGCTRQIKMADRFMAMGDPIRALHCAECVVKNYESKVSHAQTALLIAEGELRALRLEIGRATLKDLPIESIGPEHEGEDEFEPVVCALDNTHLMEGDEAAVFDFATGRWYYCLDCVIANPNKAAGE